MTIPNPGSDAAKKLGCTCPVLDNGHGTGSAWGAGVFIYTVGCPVHSQRLGASKGGRGRPKGSKIK